MGQYWKIVNLDKKEWLDPHFFMEGHKLMEFTTSGRVLSGLSVLLASSNGLGGGDLRVDPGWEDIPGRWAGSRVVVAGSYDEREGSPGNGIYDLCNEGTNIEQLLNAGGDIKTYVDISARVLGALLSDEWFRLTFLLLPDGPGNEYHDNRQRESWAAARPGEIFPRDLDN